ncbi:MAG: hypothetical protein ISR96_06680 [Nitrospira sp.]|nr:hypothetical protein [bacterium]MBL7049180.1 hypothetical protein [Nitrospira sp.]
MLLLLIPISSYSNKSPEVPEPLKPWVGWVLEGHEEEYLCIPRYNNSNQLRCSWPTELQLSAGNHGGTFKQEWLVNHESWIMLPGNEFQWPGNVMVNNRAVEIMKRSGRPHIKLAAGSYKVSGEFSWSRMPEYLQIPGDNALFSLMVNEEKSDFPNIDAQGRVWLQSRGEKEEVIENRLGIESYRMFDDRIPPRVVLFIKLDVSGAAREIVLGPAFSPDEFIPISLDSPLPARVENDGRIRVQIRPGQWMINLTVRRAGPISAFTFIAPEDGFWPKEEVWVFSARTDLRIVEIEGLTPIDPQQTSLPESWREFPAYRVLSGDTMNFMEIKRGDPEPAPDQMTVERKLWLKFDGSGYTVKDSIKGRKSSDWRLEMNPPVKLGRVIVDGVEQFITSSDGSERAGIELRKGQVDLIAESEYSGSISQLPATGWEHDFQRVSTQLFLPPGYRIIHASGVDNIPDTWLARWTLLDLFVVLIFTISLGRLYSAKHAVLAFITMVLLYHEPGAPRWIWLALLAGSALLKHIEEGRFRKMVKVYQISVIVILIVIAIPFAIQQLRVGIYPQLEKPWHSMSRTYPAVPAAVREEISNTQAEMSSMLDYAMPEKFKDNARQVMKSQGAARYEEKRIARVAQYDPSMVNQTGPGLPSWEWNTVHMESGPVHRDQQVSLVLIGPRGNLVLSFLRVGLVILLAMGMFGIRYIRGQGWQYPGLKTFLSIVILLFSLASSGSVSASEIPSPQMLDELRSRLLQQDDCFPGCAEIQTMHINITPDVLEIKMQVDAQLDVAVPLPGSVKHWLPGEVTIDGKRADAMYGDSNGFFALISKGRHEVVLKGALPRYNTIQLPLPLKPHQLSIKQSGWTSEGLHPDGMIEKQILFKRITVETNSSNQVLDSGVLPPFAVLERNLLIGLEWKVETTIRRISPVGAAMVLDIPLIPGEAVITAGIVVKDGSAQISLDAKATQLSWESVLERTEVIELTHSETHLWTEIWQADVSPVYHMEYEGIPVILHQQGDHWSPKWHPWPGEKVQLYISRPAGIEGQTLTVDKSLIEVRPGQRVTDSKIALSVRSSQGGQHTIVLPAGAELQEVLIGGRQQSIRQEERNVTLPIVPGKQEIMLHWRVNNGISAIFKTPEIDLGIHNVNANISVYLPENRWPLYFSGPLMGPAILFWSVVIVTILVAFGLSKTGLTPLRFRHWLLLGIGLSQSSIVISLFVVGWLIAFHFRGKADSEMGKRRFNLMQCGLAVLTVFAVVSLVSAISQGLLGHPDMNILGNGSNSGILRWYLDYSARIMPSAMVLSVPMIYYRLAMLAWALWISFGIVSILKWAWRNYSKPVIWQSIPRKNKPLKKDRGEGEGPLKTD